MTGRKKAVGIDNHHTHVCVDCGSAFLCRCTDPDNSKQKVGRLCHQCAKKQKEHPYYGDYLPRKRFKR